jgi:chromosome segregation ATPase
VTSPEDPEAPEDAANAAYLNRTSQLHEARAALGEAVHAMRLELDARREENESLHARYSALEKEWKELGAEVKWQREERARLIAETEECREQLERLQQELSAAQELNATYRNMKVFRWTAWPRRIAHRLRGRGG